MSPSLVFPKVRMTQPYKLDLISYRFVTCTNRPTNVVRHDACLLKTWFSYVFQLLYSQRVA